MSKILEKFTAIALLVAASCGVGLAQVAPTTILEIDVENRVSYTDDIPDVSKLATDPNATTAIPSRNFRKSVTIGDIVSVNGQPTKGTFVGNFRQILFRPEPTPGQAIADITRNSVLEFSFEILKIDGTPIGAIMAAGLGTGSAIPGAPLAVTQGNVAIVGGTGAFLGARGQLGQAVTAQTIPDRQASMSEDPANRRKHGGGGRSRFLVHVTPLARPEIVSTPGGPAIFRSDFSLVNAAQPARAGEVLILIATGLGPTRPGVDPGKPFPADPLPEVNSPLEVTVNGRPAEILLSIGRPGTIDRYRVDIRVPEGTAAGPATIHLSTAWIAGPDVTIAIQ
jgi:uncharacterized protein (TIGR03437 family)